MSDMVSLKGRTVENWLCVDCGTNTAPGVPSRIEMEIAFLAQGERGNGVPLQITSDSEIYMVRDRVWAAAGMTDWGGCLCIGCLEARLGRRLKRKDFLPDHPLNSDRFPCTERLRERRGGRPIGQPPDAIESRPAADN